MNGHGSTSSEDGASARITSLLAQCDVLLSEISSLQSLLPDPHTRRGKHAQTNLSVPGDEGSKFPRHIWSPTIDLRPIRNAIVNEQRSLKKLHEQSLASAKLGSRRSETGSVDLLDSDDSEDDGMSDKKISHTLRSSNLPFHSTVWQVSKRRTGIVTYFYRAHLQKPEDGSAAMPTKSKRGKAYRKQILVDDAEIVSSTNSTPVNGSDVTPTSSNAKTPKGRRSQMVDIVANDGMEWIKVSTVPTARLELAKRKADWEANAFDLDHSDEDEDIGRKVTPALQSMYISSSPETERRQHSDDSSDDGTQNGEKQAIPELVRIAHDLRTASLAARVNYVHPRVVFVLPNIVEGESEIVDDILAEIRGTGATIECGEAFELSTFDPRDMLSDPKAELTSTLNIDCTILLALISDVSHLEHTLVTDHLVRLAKAQAANGSSEHASQPTDPHPAIQRQILLEKDDSLLQSTLYPILTHSPSVTLVTSAEAAQRCIDIASIIGTAGEKRRASILFAGDSFASCSPSELRATLQETSIHPVPGLNLPIQIIEPPTSSSPEYLDELPSYAPVVASNLSDINKSVFMLGWAKRWTTVTSNKSVAKIMVDCVDGELDALQTSDESSGEYDPGPKLWVCAVARSLIGKESARRR